MKELVYKTYHLANAAEQRIWRTLLQMDAPRIFYGMYNEDLVGFRPDGKPVFEPNGKGDMITTVVQWSIVTCCESCRCENCDDCVCDMPALLWCNEKKNKKKKLWFTFSM